MNLEAKDSFIRDQELKGGIHYRCHGLVILGEHEVLECVKCKDLGDSYRVTNLKGFFLHNKKNFSFECLLKLVILILIPSFAANKTNEVFGRIKTA